MKGKERQKSAIDQPPKLITPAGDEILLCIRTRNIFRLMETADSLLLA
jgi:hypothetical protein